MPIQRLLIFTIISTLLFGCGAPFSPYNFSVSNLGISKRKIDADIRSTTVSFSNPNEKTGDLSGGWEEIAPLWQSALIEALNKKAIFQDDASKKANVVVKILKIDLPTAGASITVDITARYELLDRKTGEIIFTQDISSKGTTPFGYSLSAINRSRESINRAVQDNIKQFLIALEQS
jgi:hypothetical protein